MKPLIGYLLKYASKVDQMLFQHEDRIAALELSREAARPAGIAVENVDESHSLERFAKGNQAGKSLDLDSSVDITISVFDPDLKRHPAEVRVVRLDQGGNLIINVKRGDPIQQEGFKH